MFEADKNLTRVLMMAGIFRLDQGRWPQTAVELMGFTEEKGWNLDLSPYHTLTFQTDEWRCLVLEVSRMAEGDWLTRERIDVEPYFFEGNESMPLRIQSKVLPPQKAERRFFCQAS
ncbi:MAG TPA: hypothetical protein VIJ93_09930 [bacterium]